VKIILIEWGKIHTMTENDDIMRELENTVDMAKGIGDRQKRNSRNI